LNGDSEHGKPGLKFASLSAPGAVGSGILESLSPGPVVLRVFLFLILLVGFSAALGSMAEVAGLLTPATDFTKSIFYSECTRAAATVLAASVMSRLEGRTLGEYGLPWVTGQGRLVLQGAVFGIAEIGAIVGVLAATGYYSFGALELHGAMLVKWALFWAVLFAVVGFFEEYAFRGYGLFALTKGFGFWPATIVTSAIFGAVHMRNPGESWPGIAGVVAVGIFWCFTLQRTGTLWFALGMHAAFDFGETFLFSVPDSGVIFPGHLSSAVIHDGPAWLVGGTAGPEASVLDFVILAIFFYIVHRMYPAKPELPRTDLVQTIPLVEVAPPIEPRQVNAQDQRTSSEA
jgi:membrane protease YdiL (CAAX protease family)